MFVIKHRKSRKFAFFCIISLTMLFLSYTYHDPSLYFLKLAFRQPSGHFSKGPCSCTTCITEMDDDWFSEHFNQSIPPLLSKKNSLLSEDTYNWWQWLFNPVLEDPKTVHISAPSQLPEQKCGLSGRELGWSKNMDRLWVPEDRIGALLFSQWYHSMIDWLQREKDPANYSDVVQRLFEVIPDEEWYIDSGPGRCRTCAVVGNSGNLKGSSYGARINSHDFVIRMNHAPTLGYEDDVGSKTTHHLMYPESAKHLKNSTSLVLVPFKTLDLEWIISALTTGTITQTYIPVKSRIKANKDKVLVYNPTFFKYVYDTWLENHGRYPSTGFLALMFAIHVCDKVSAYGFGADMKGNWHHYWENNPGAGAFRHTGVHDGDYEYNITMLLAEKDKIQVFKGR